MHFLLISAGKDLRRMLRDPIGLSAWIAMPLIICALVSLISGGGSVSPQGKLLIVDQDKTFLSGVLGQAFNTDPLNKIVQTESVDYDAGRQIIDNGDASALLLIPSGFSVAFLRSKPVELTLLTNPSQRILPVIIEQALATEIDAGFYVQRLLGSDFDTLTQSGLSNVATLQASVKFNQVARQAAAFVYPPLIKVETQVINSKRENTNTSLVILFYPGFLILAVFGLAQSASEDIWKERSKGTLRRLQTTPRSLMMFLGGKTLALIAIFICIAAVGLLLAHFGIHAETNNVVVAIVWLAVSGVMLYLMAALLQVSSSEQRTGVLLNALVLFVLAMLGGTFFPFELMPSWLARIGRFTPNGLAVAQFKQLVSGSVETSSIALSFAAVVVFIALAFMLLTRIVRRWSA